jgi:hypothetical protein
LKRGYSQVRILPREQSRVAEWLKAPNVLLSIVPRLINNFADYWR